MCVLSALLAVFACSISLYSTVLVLMWIKILFCVVRTDDSAFGARFRFVGFFVFVLYYLLSNLD